jgi:superfamily II DNA or RNA helicase
MSKPTLNVTFLSVTEILVEGGPELREWREANRVKIPDVEHTYKYKRTNWDGTRVPGKWCRQVCKGVWQLQGSRGLLIPLREAFDLKGTERGSTPIHNLPEGFLREHQEEALTKGLVERWGRVALATNAGKGAVIALITKTLHERLGVRSLVLCDEIAVFGALVEEIEKWAHITPGRVESGVKDPPRDEVVVAMIPTLSKRLKATEDSWASWAASFGCVLLDEADKANAKTWRRVLATTLNSEWRLGFSGTFPMDDLEKGDRFARMEMDELMGGVLVRATNADMVELGVSARPFVTLRAYSCVAALQGVRLPRGRTEGTSRRRIVFEAAIVHNAERHRFVASLVQDGAPTAIVVNRIDHGHNLVQTILGAVFLHGSASKVERDRVLGAFRRGEFDVLVTTKILDRGTNMLGRAADLIFASAEGSVRQTLQRIGRGLRREDGKEFLRLVDVIDRGHRYLHKAAEKRIALYNAEGFDVEAIS